MKRGVIVVEGNTEMQFVNKFLKQEIGFDLDVINLRGGKLDIPTLITNIRPLLSSNFSLITTMVDFYRFKNPERVKSIEDIEQELTDEIDKIRTRSRTKFIPYLQKYEFESLLFSNMDKISEYLELSAQQKSKLQKGIPKVPEEINHDNPPSSRLIEIHKRYRKSIDGISIIKAIGMPQIKKKCPRFKGWIEQLKKIAQ